MKDLKPMWVLEHKILLKTELMGHQEWCECARDMEPPLCGGESA